MQVGVMINTAGERTNTLIPISKVPLIFEYSTSAFDSVKVYTS